MTRSCVLIVRWKWGESSKNHLKTGKSFLRVSERHKEKRGRRAEHAFLSGTFHLCSIFLRTLFFWAAEHSFSVSPHTHTHREAVGFSTSKPFHTGWLRPRLWREKTGILIPKGFMFPSHSALLGAIRAALVSPSTRIKISVSPLLHRSTKKNLKMESRNLRGLPPGAVCASQYGANLCSGPAYFHLLLQLSLLPFMANEDNVLPLLLKRIEGAADYVLFYSYEYARQARKTECIKEIAYQCVIKCNACTLNEICMTNWLWRAQSRQVLWTFAQWLIEIPFISTVALPRDREWEGRTEKDECNDLPCIIGYTWISPQKDYTIPTTKTKARCEDLVVLFTNVAILPQCHSMGYI